jgi:hypothetical protein
MEFFRERFVLLAGAGSVVATLADFAGCVAGVAAGDDWSRHRNVMSEGDAAVGGAVCGEIFGVTVAAGFDATETFFDTTGGFCAVRAGAIDSGATSVDALSLGRSENCMVSVGTAFCVILGGFGRAVAVSTAGAVFALRWTDWFGTGMCRCIGAFGSVSPGCSNGRGAPP